MMVEKILKKYQFDSVFGFVIQTPLEKLDPYFDPWINLVKKIEILRKTNKPKVDLQNVLFDI